MEETDNPRAQIYLAGAIQHAPDGGVGWRNQIKPVLEANGYAVIDPLDGEKDSWNGHGLEIFDWDTIRRPENKDKYKQLMGEFVDKDLNAVLRSDIVFVYYDEYIEKGAGTLGEITVARLHGVYVLVMLAPTFKEKQLPGWVVGCTDKIIKTTGELLGALDEAVKTIEETEPDWEKLGMESFAQLMSDEEWITFEEALAEDYE